MSVDYFSITWLFILLPVITTAAECNVKDTANREAVGSAQVTVVGKLRPPLLPPFDDEFWIRICDSEECWRTEVADHLNRRDKSFCDSVPGLRVQKMRLEQNPKSNSEVSLHAKIENLIIGECYSFEFHHDQDENGEMTRIARYLVDWGFIKFGQFLYPDEATGLSKNPKIVGGVNAETLLKKAWKEICVRIDHSRVEVKFNARYFRNNVFGDNLYCDYDDLSPRN